MKKIKVLFVVLLVLMMGVLPMRKTEDNNFDEKQLSVLVEDVLMDTVFNEEDYNYSANVSRKYSDFVGMSEWIGL